MYAQKKSGRRAGTIFLDMFTLRLGAMLDMKTDTALLEECVNTIETSNLRPRIRLHLLDYIMENVTTMDGVVRHLDKK